VRDRLQRRLLGRDPGTVPHLETHADLGHCLARGPVLFQALRVLENFQDARLGEIEVELQFLLQGPQFPQGVFGETGIHQGVAFEALAAAIPKEFHAPGNDAGQRAWAQQQRRVDPADVTQKVPADAGGIPGLGMARVQHSAVRRAGAAGREIGGIQQGHR
jgi:hypothetical protein